jgi:hypothetical protein
VLSTLTTASEDGPLKNLPKEKAFDVAVIDECSQVGWAIAIYYSRVVKILQSRPGGVA